MLGCEAVCFAGLLCTASKLGVIKMLLRNFRDYIGTVWSDSSAPHGNDGAGAGGTILEPSQWYGCGPKGFRLFWVSVDLFSVYLRW